MFGYAVIDWHFAYLERYYIANYDRNALLSQR